MREINRCCGLVFLLAGLSVPAAWLLAAPTTQGAGSGLHGHVMLPDGKPATGATVFVALPGPSNLRIRNGRIAFEDLGGQMLTHVTTGANGSYDLPGQTGKYLVAAIGDAGYAQLDQDALATSSDLTLTPWGQIRGRLMIGTKPGAAVNLQAWTKTMQRDNSVQISMVNRAQTDANGDFTMDCVLPGHVEIDRVFEQPSGTTSMGFFGQVGSADVTAGQTTIVKLGGVGRPVVGKFVFPSTLNPTDYFINARAIPIRGGTEDYFLLVDGQQHFRMENVPAGNYRIHVFLQKVHGDRTGQPNQVRFTMPPIPGGVSDEPLVIPDIQLQ